MRVRDIMTIGVRTIVPTATCEKAWESMRGHNIHHLVVTQGGTVVGVLSERDCGGRRGAALGRDRTVEQMMSSPAVTVAPDASVRRAANMMRGRSIGCLVVVEDGRATGIVTVSDLLEFVGRHSGVRDGGGTMLHSRVAHRKQHGASGLW